MNIINIKMPSDIRYLSDWNEYSIPFGHCIIDKVLTGCGFTEYCIRNRDDIILCSPRKLLLENKAEQHKNRPEVLYLKNENEGLISFDCDLNEKKQLREQNLKNAATVIPKQTYQEYIGIFKSIIDSHIVNCRTTCRPIKFLVTYDSLHYFVKFLGDRIKYFKVVVDEYQSILTDSSFKPNTELDFAADLQRCPNVCYVSATPIMDKYLNMMDEFNQLDYYKFDWSDSRYFTMENPKVDRKQVSDVILAGKRVIERYLSGDYPKKVDKNQVIHESHEAVIYLNSVGDIIKLVKACRLTPGNTDIICSNTKKNRKKLKKIGFDISKPHLKSDMRLNKMFTFCTRTVYLGADFYSDNANSYILSNPNLEHLAVDIAFDLPQIIGRQRLDENPWKNSCTLYYQLTSEIESIQSHTEYIEKKIKISNDKLKMYSELSDSNKILQLEYIQNYLETKKYAKDYVGLLTRAKDKDDNLDWSDYSKLEPRFNTLVLLAEQRAWEIKQGDYVKDLYIRVALENQRIDSVYITNQDEELVKGWISKINSTPVFSDGMKYYCDAREVLSGKDPYLIRKLNYNVKNSDYETYFNYYGIKQIRLLDYMEKNLKENLGKNQPERLKSEFLSRFKPGDKISKKDAKQIIKEIYSRLEVIATPKAKDLTQYFEVKEITIYMDKDKINGFEILSVK